MRTILLLVFSFLILSGCDKKSDPNAVIYQTDFSSEAGQWADATNSACCAFKDGHYEVSNNDPDNIVWGFVPMDLINTDFSMKADLIITPQNTSLAGAGGFVFNYVNHQNFKVFQISSAGYFRVFQALNNVITELQAWKSSTHINLNGSSNTVQINQHPSHIDFQVNGTSVFELNEAHQYGFKVGLAASSFSGIYFTPVIVQFDNLIVTKLD